VSLWQHSRGLMPSAGLKSSQLTLQSWPMGQTTTHFNSKCHITCCYIKEVNISVFTLLCLPSVVVCSWVDLNNWIPSLIPALYRDSPPKVKERSPPLTPKEKTKPEKPLASQKVSIKNGWVLCGRCFDFSVCIIFIFHAYDLPLFTLLLLLVWAPMRNT
jgi:hypothetical protein